MSKEDIVCGSHLYSESEVFNTEVHRYASSTKAILADSKASISEKHNAYTAYCMTAINYSSGHRSVRDPMAYREDISLEDGWLLINDKSSSRATETRVVALSEGAVEILAAYIKHLSGLASELAKVDGFSYLSSSICSLLEPAHYAKQALPLFFFLDDENEVLRVSPGTMKRENVGRWRYELNHNRHFLETGLSRKGLSSILIDCHLGHQHGISHPLGLNSNQTHKEYTDNITPLLNELFEESGWEVINGESGEVDRFYQHSKPHKLHRYGQYERRSRRNKLGKYIKDEAMEVALQIVEQYGIERVCKDEGVQKTAVDQLFVQLKIAKHYKRKSINSLRDAFLSIAKDCGVELDVQISSLVAEESPFKDRWVAKYRYGKSLKNAFVNEMTEKPFQPRTLEEGWACVIASAVLVGGLYNHKWCEYLLESGPVVMKKMMNWVMYADICIDKKKDKKGASSHKSPDWRWHPDAFSKSIILTLAARFDGLDKNKFSHKRCRQHFNGIINKIGVRERKGREPIVATCVSMRNYWIRYLPAYMVKVMDGVIRTSPLPEQALARLCYERRSSNDAKGIDEYRETVVGEAEEEKPASVSDYLYRMGKIISEVGGRDQAKPSVQLKRLREKTLLLHSSYLFPTVCRALSQWLVHATLHGTRDLETPAISTVKRYFYAISKPLCMLLYKDKLLEIDEERLTYIYKLVVEHNNTDAVIRYLSLRQFNDVINDYGLVEVSELDWRHIGATLKKLDIRRPDTNIVTNTELSQCLNAVFKTVDNIYSKYIICTALIICYRFGLRVGELVRLRIQDIQIEGSKVVLQVVATEFGKTKSFSGVRQVPLLGEMSAEELEIFKKQIEIATGFLERGRNSLLLFNADNPGFPVDVEWLRRNLHITMRHICGDKRIKIHHLRHSYITTLYHALTNQYGHHVASTIGESRRDLVAAISEQFAVNISNAAPMGILSLLAGHSSVLTSIHTYSHLVDDAIAGYVDSVDIGGLSINGISNLLNQPTSRLMNRVNKYGLSRKDNVYQSLLKSIRPSMGIKNFDIKVEKWPQRIPLEYQRRELDFAELDRVLIMYGIHNHSVENISHYTGHSIDTLAKAFKAASKISNKLSIQIYGDLNKNSNYWFEEEKHVNYLAKYDAGRLNALLKNIHSTPVSSLQSSTICLAIDAWAKSLIAQERGLTVRFNKPDDLNDFLDGCELLGYRRYDFYGRYSNVLEGEHEVSIKKMLKQLGINDVTAGKARRLESGEDIHRLAFVDINIKRKLHNEQLPASIKIVSKAMFLIGTMIHIESL